ncbi:MAG: hypothetical protein KDD69_03095 [Bdellovibrionales bacterium]|nr:hypothetical protein [Bdellovibrionales bacterium]
MSTEREVAATKAVPRVGLFLLAALGLSSAMVLVVLVLLGLQERRLLTETEQQRYQRLAREISEDCPRARTGETEAVFRACREGSLHCSEEFPRLIEVLSKVVRSTSDPGCTKAVGRYAADSFENVRARIELTPNERKSLLQLGRIRLTALLRSSRLWSVSTSPTSKEIDEEFRRVQRAIGAPETGAPPWGNRAPPQDTPASTFKSVGSSIQDN